MKGELLLLPNLLNKEASHELYLPTSVDRAIDTLQGLICESEKEARAYLKRFKLSGGRTFRDIPLAVFNEHSEEVDPLLEPMKRGEKWGLISDAGLPVLADPGYQLVRRASDFGIRVKAFVGPSSLIQALLLSGLPGQRFSFHGYVPKRNPEEKLRQMEMRSKEEQMTQIMIEAPYRNEKLMETLLATLSEDTLLCVAWDLTLPTQGVETHTIRAWRKRSMPSIHKRPAIFLFLST